MYTLNWRAMTAAPATASVHFLTARVHAIRLSPLAEKAYRHVKQLVLSNQLHGGEYVLEEELANAVGMSRTPLREACIALQNEGLVAIVPRRGIRIVPLTVADMREVYQVLDWLESQAAATLARRPDRAGYVSELRRLTEQMERALARGDLDAWARDNDRFHVELVASAGNGRLSRICENLLDQSQRVRAFTLRARKPPKYTTDFHARMLKAIERGDAERAAAIQHENKQAWLAELEELIERLKLRYL
jgi:DNA-binding GntR family transcriptional regulator